MKGTNTILSNCDEAFQVKIDNNRKQKAEAAAIFINSAGIVF